MESIERLMPTFNERKKNDVLTYLRLCGLTEPTIQTLLTSNMIYADEDGNPIFIDRKRNVAEILMLSLNKNKDELTLFREMQSYHNGVDCYWQFGDWGGKIYICTTALDALCLRELQMEKGINESEIYASISGAKDDLLEKILRKVKKECILAINNDEYSVKLRERFPENKKKNLYHLRPEGINWTEDLLRYKE